MALSKDLSSFEDIRHHLETALSSQKGIRITTHSPGAATHLRQRFNQLRKLSREATSVTFPVGDARRGTSPYDELAFQLEGASVLLKKVGATRVEEL